MVADTTTVPTIGLCSSQPNQAKLSLSCLSNPLSGFCVVILFKVTVSLLSGFVNRAQVTLNLVCVTPVYIVTAKCSGKPRQGTVRF